MDVPLLFINSAPQNQGTSACQSLLIFNSKPEHFQILCEAYVQLLISAPVHLLCQFADHHSISESAFSPLHFFTPCVPSLQRTCTPASWPLSSSTNLHTCISAPPHTCASVPLHLCTFFATPLHLSSFIKAPAPALALATSSSGSYLFLCSIAPLDPCTSVPAPLLLCTSTCHLLLSPLCLHSSAPLHLSIPAHLSSSQYLESCTCAHVHICFCNFLQVCPCSAPAQLPLLFSSGKTMVWEKRKEIFEECKKIREGVPHCERWENSMKIREGLRYLSHRSTSTSGPMHLLYTNTQRTPSSIPTPWRLPRRIPTSGFWP